MLLNAQAKGYKVYSLWLSTLQNQIDSAYLFEKVNVNGPTSNSVSKCVLYRLWIRPRFIEYLNDAD